MTKEQQNTLQPRTTSSERESPVSAKRNLTSSQLPQQESLSSNSGSRKAAPSDLGAQPAPTYRITRRGLIAAVTDTTGSEAGTTHNNSYIDPMDAAMPEKMSWRDRISGKKLSKVDSNAGSSGSGMQKTERSSEMGRGEVMPELITEKKVNWIQATLSMKCKLHSPNVYFADLR